MIGEHVGIMFVTLYVTMNFDKHDKIQLLAKSKKNSIDPDSEPP